jgi:16S rRNA (guanine966-N2)-methyltransferase
MRIVAGRFRGRPLATPSDQRIRPTSDRVREAVFNILAHGIDNCAIEAARVLDLFAGTGALGLEALSRGAASCLFVEEDATARGLIRQNIEAMRLTGVTRIYRRDATELGAAGTRDRYDIAFIDPPYGKGLGEKALGAAVAGGWLADGAIVVLEECKGAMIVWPAGTTYLETRSWGDTAVHFARAHAPSERERP